MNFLVMQFLLQFYQTHCKARSSISDSSKRFSVLQNTNAISGAHRNFHVIGIGNPFVGVKRRERDADHSHFSRDVV